MCRERYCGNEGFRPFGPKGLVGSDACSMAAYTQDCLSKLPVLGDFPVKSRDLLKI